MKKILPTLCIIYSLSASSQNFNRGDKLFGGNVSLNTYSNNSNSFSSNSSNIGLIPSFSWLIKSNLAFGIRGGINYSHTKSESQGSADIKNTNTNAIVGAFLRKYKLIKDKFGLYLDNELSFSLNSNRNGSTPTYLKTVSEGVGYKFSPGVFYKFTNHFLGEANIGGIYAAYSNGGSTNSFNAGLSFLQYFNVGVNYRFEGKKKT